MFNKILRSFISNTNLRINKVDRLFYFLFHVIIILFSIIYTKNNLRAPVDDSYITYRYAQNFANGNGLVFNKGEYFYGSTAMGFALVLGCLKLIIQFLLDTFHVVYTIPIHKVAVAVSGLSLWLIGTIWNKIINFSHFSIVRWLVSLCLAVYFFVSSYSNAVPGHETYTFFALLMLFEYLFFYSKKYLASALVATAAFMVRPDTLLFIAIALSVYIINFLIKEKKSLQVIINIWPFIIVFGTLILAWELFLRFYFGSWLPETMIAKKAQVDLGYFKLFNFNNVTEAIQVTAFPGFYILLGFSLGIFVFYIMQKYSSRQENFHEKNEINVVTTVLWLSFAFGLIASYTFFRVTLWRWYEAPIYFALLNTLSTSLLLFIDHISFNNIIHEKHKLAFISLSLIAFMFTLKGTYQDVKLWATTPHINSHTYSYDPIIEYLHQVEPMGTTIATAEPGALGYKLGENYIVIDYLGLISPGVANALISNDRSYYFQRWRPKYIIISWSGSYTPVTDQWFKENYVLTREFKHPYWDKNLGRGIFLYKIKE